MWIVYQKSDKKIVAASADSPQPVPKEEALREAVNGLGEGHDVKNYDAVEMKDPAQVGALLRSIGEGKARLEEGTKGASLMADSAAESASLTVTVEGAQEFHPVDQVPMIQATPSAFVTIKIQKVDSRGKPLTRKTVDKEVLWLRTDFGFLRADQGPGGTSTSAGMMPPDVRSVALAAGVASFRLYAEPAKRLATVQILHSDPSLSGTVRVEFI